MENTCHAKHSLFARTLPALPPVRACLRCSFYAAHRFTPPTDLNVPDTGTMLYHNGMAFHGKFRDGIAATGTVLHSIYEATTEARPGVPVAMSYEGEWMSLYRVTSDYCHIWTYVL